MSVSVVGSASVPGSQMRRVVMYTRTPERQMLTARLGSIAMVGREKARRAGLPLRDAG